MIFKRKSFHLFRDIKEETITNQGKEMIQKAFHTFVPLDPTIKTAINIVDNDACSCKRGQQACILLYSEKKEGYLQNIGYLGEQLDLYLVSQNIGTLWFGIGATNETSFEGLDFVIMIAIAKIGKEGQFRKNLWKAKRKEIDEIWMGEPIKGVTDIVRFAPSACNTQPWVVKHYDHTLEIYRYKKLGKRGIMPTNKVSFYNQIDIGIFLCFLDLCLQQENIDYHVEYKKDDGLDQEWNLSAIYHLYKTVD
ncbi:MAG: nitroreductase family protein [Erysipelotrichaceae bacterium]|nr:nitroreductase family protein [Erysipelotrichaceae bacterium]